MHRSPAARFVLLLPLLALWPACRTTLPDSKTGAGPATPTATATATSTIEFDDPGRVVVPLGTARDWHDEVIYFAMTDRFFDGDPTNNTDVKPGDKGAFHGGDFVGLQRKLGYLSQLGVTVLWITPVVKQIDHPVTGAGFPDWAYHGYWADDFTRTEPRFGTLEQLQSLVRAAHSLGIKVLIDVVLNHPGYGSHWVQDTKLVRSTELGTCVESDNDLTNCLAGLPDFRTEDPQVAEMLMRWQLDWIGRTGCDGFRVDTVKHVEHGVWKEFRKKIKEIYPDFFLLGEVWGATMHEDFASEYLGDQMDSLFDFGFHGEVEGFLLSRGRPIAFSRYLERRHQFKDRMVMAHYLDTHDVPTLNHKLEGNRQLLILAAVLQFTSLGIPVVTWGNEVGRRGGEWPENRSDMLWGEQQDRELLGAYQRLIRFRQAHRALSRGSYQQLYVGEHGLGFLRSSAEGSDQVVVLLNRGPQPEAATLELPQSLGVSATWIDEWSGSGQRLTAEAGKLTVTIPARQAMLLVPAPRP